MLCNHAFRFKSIKSVMASGTRVYVGRVPNDAREKDVERFFKGYGRLREVLMKNGYTFVVRNIYFLLQVLFGNYLVHYWLNASILIKMKIK